MIDDPNIPNGTPEDEDSTPSTRRQMLLKLGLAVGALYTAPAFANLSEAQASSFSTVSGRGRRRRRRRQGQGNLSSPSRDGMRVLRPRNL